MHISTDSKDWFVNDQLAKDIGNELNELVITIDESLVTVSLNGLTVLVVTVKSSEQIVITNE